MRELFTLAGNIFLGLVVIVVMYAVLMMAGGLAYSNPVWLLLTLPAAFAIDALILATYVKFWLGNR